MEHGSTTAVVATRRGPRRISCPQKVPCPAGGMTLMCMNGSHGLCHTVKEKTLSASQVESLDSDPVLPTVTSP